MLVFLCCETIKTDNINVKKTKLKNTSIIKIKKNDSFIKLNEKTAIPFLFEY